MTEQVITFVATGINLKDTLDQARDQVNRWLKEHPAAVVNTIDTELVPREHNAGEWVYAVTVAVRMTGIAGD